MTKNDRDAGPYAGLHHEKQSAYEGSSGGWGSVRALTGIFAKTGASAAAATVLPQQNKPGGVACCQLRLGQAGRFAHLRILRERRQGHRLGRHFAHA